MLNINHVINSKDEIVTFEQLSSVEELIENSDNIHLPNQLGAILNNRLLQHYVILQSSSMFINYPILPDKLTDNDRKLYVAHK